MVCVMHALYSYFLRKYPQDLAIKKEWNAIYSNMAGPRDDHNKWSETEKDKNHMIALRCGILKNDTNKHIYKPEADSQR